MIILVVIGKALGLYYLRIEISDKSSILYNILPGVGYFKTADSTSLHPSNCSLSRHDVLYVIDLCCRARQLQ